MIGIGKWGVWYWADRDNCVVMDNVQYKIDIQYDNKEKSCSLTVKCSNNDPCDLTIPGFDWKGEKYTKVIRQTEFDPKEIKQKVIETINEIDSIKNKPHIACQFSPLVSHSGAGGFYFCSGFKKRLL